MANAHKAKGTKWESDIRNYMRDEMLDYEKSTQLGSVDEGDGTLRTPENDLRIVVEAKAEARYDLARYVREAKVEAETYAKNRHSLNANFGYDDRNTFGVAFVKAPRKTVGEGYAVMRIADFVDLVGTWL